MRSALPLCFFLPAILGLVDCGEPEPDIFERDHYRFKQPTSTEIQAAQNAFFTGIQLYRKQRQPAEASKQFEEAVKLAPNWEYYFELANSYVDTDRHDVAMAAYNVALELGPDEPAVVYYNMACAKSLVRNPSFAYDLLEKALIKGYDNFAHIRSDPDLEYLRKHDPRFVDLITRYDTNLTTFEKNLIGIWQVGSPIMAAGWGASYAFFPDRVVIYRPGGADCAQRLKANRGTWIATGTRLDMVFDFKEVLVGGKLVEAVGSCLSEYEIEGATTDRVAIEPPESHTLLIESQIAPDPESPGAKYRVVLDGRTLWRMTDDPADY